MKATTKRLLVVLAVVMLLVSVMGISTLATEAIDEPVCYIHGDVNGDGEIDSRDAIRTLFYALWNDSVSVNQNCDFNEDDSVTQKDAIYLLFVSLEMDGYESKGTVHTYMEPVWHWETAGAQPVATVSLKCACGTPHPITEGISVLPGEEKAPTCVADGFKKYTAKVTYDGKEYENSVTVTVPTDGDGHSFASAPTCEEGVKCQNCDFIKPALGHSYALNGEKTEGCAHTKQYKCAICQNEIAGTAESDVYYTHSYTAKLDKEATCTEEGEQTLTCVCGDVQKEKLPVNADFHVWDNRVEDKGVTTYTCACGETKTVVQMSAAGVSSDVLKENEVQLDETGTSVALDEATAEQLDADKEVKITVAEVDKTTVGLNAEKLEQIGDAKIYDFSMLSGNQPVTDFNGEVTVSLPYELRDGDDVNDIDVWYIDNNGNVQSFEGKYNNGFVTFRTKHFSYYTVTRMTPAERCARYGHNMVEQNKAATCTEDGYAKKFCLRCGFVEKDENISRLGHDHQIDEERSVDATCNAPGQKVEICSRCNNEKTEDIKQLSHDWEKTESVAASCTAKGYDKSVCKLCKEEKVENEQPATGHSFAVNEEGWQWTEDHGKAAVTLICENEGCKAQKTLDAVITKKLDGSVCLGGSATYTATVNHNNKTYTETATGQEAGSGQHTLGSEWVATDTQHYQICAVCDEKVGLADHDWERNVTQQPTCGKSGKATETCSVCEKQREVILPATGEHNLVNGVCSACGHTEGSCNHRRLYEREIDLSEYGCCEGVLVVMSCECGKVSQMYDVDVTCDFENTEEENEETESTTYKSVCKNCGLVGQMKDYCKYDEENCAGKWVQQYLFTKGQTEILNAEYEYYSFSHPVVVKHEPVDLRQFGLCGGILKLETCYCGFKSSAMWQSTEEDCNWIYDEETELSVCTKCGVSQKAERQELTESCFSGYKYLVSYLKNGQTLYSYTICMGEESHDYELGDYELYGETCEDGVFIQQVCSDCDESKERYYEYCVPCQLKKTIDTTGMGFCSDAIEIRGCPCGSYNDYDFVYADDALNYHQWSGNSENKMSCYSCGFTRTIQETRTEKDENCHLDITKHYTFANSKGNSFTFTTVERATDHALKYSFVMAGKTCEDGVTITETCEDCGYTYTWKSEGHYTVLKETLDLSAVACGGGVAELYACACGNESRINLPDECSWDTVDVEYSEDGVCWIYQCESCDLVMKEQQKTGSSEDPCYSVRLVVNSFFKDGEELGSLTERHVYENHSYVYQMTLSEGATSCADGYSYIATCQTCGDQESGSSGGFCNSRPVERKVVSTEDMCGVMQRVTYRCACGKEESTTINWVNEQERCQYSEKYDDDLNAWVYTCVDCGSYYHYASQMQPVPGTTCENERIETYYYYNKAGQLLTTTESSWTSFTHDMIYSFTLLGDTCADGYTWTATCADCGEIWTSDEPQYGCESREIVERTLVYDNDAICGPVYLYHHSCACGAVESYSVNDSCQEGSWENRRFTCSDCGMVNTNSYSYRRIPGTCRQSVDMEYVFFLNGEEVARVERTYEEVEHLSVYSYEMFGDTCEEGYRVYENCAYCDYSSICTETSGHNTYRTQYYEFPEGSCGGHVSVYSCPCKKECRVEYSYDDCSTSGKSWTETDENGIVHQFNKSTCSKCGLIVDQEWYYTEGTDPCHKVVHQDYTWTLDDWELNLSGTSTSEQHNYKNITLTPVNPENCEDGVEVFMRCAYCGDEYTTIQRYGHPVMVVETIDLAQYGSVCGAKLEKVECACGEQIRYELSNETLCDLDKKEIAHFVEGTIDDNEYSTEGWGDTWSYSYSYICSVTEPACGLNIRSSRYWLVKDCVATEYETWQLGYDPKTDTCQKELTVATGRTGTYHNYESAYEEKVVDGNTVSGTKYTCVDCGSYYTTLSYYEGSRQVKFERYAKNLLNNGEALERTEILEHVYVNDRQLLSRQRDEWKNADGSTQWKQWTYTYSFEGGCQRAEVYTDSEGGSNTSAGEWHDTKWTTEWIQSPTCTQSGSYYEREICNFCDKKCSEQLYQANPTAHSWSWNGDKQTYVCEGCGLENVNAASGSIVMEDLTEGTGTDYVIGYWNRDNVQFNPYVSLVLYDAAEGEDDELVLDSISVKMLTVDSDGICGLSFNKAATAETASAALKAAGYTGTYAVRISCVPLGSTDVLDYAITFETLTAE